MAWVEEELQWQPVSKAGFGHEKLAVYVWRSVRADGDTKTQKSRWTLEVPDEVARAREIVKTCGSRSLDCFRLGVLSGSFYEFAVDEGRAGTDQGDEVGSVDGVPAVLRCLDDPACDAVSGLEGAQFVDLGITRRGGRICALRCAGTDCPADAQAAEPVQQAIAGLVIHRCFPPLGAGGGLRGGPRRPVCGRIPPARDPQR